MLPVRDPYTLCGQGVTDFLCVPSTETVDAHVLKNGGPVSIDSFFSREGAVTFPASHRNLWSFNVGLGAIVFVGHVILLGQVLELLIQQDEWMPDQDLYLSNCL
jgi:hypothetical protein